jgi:hypothetical protein
VGGGEGGGVLTWPTFSPKDFDEQTSERNVLNFDRWIRVTGTVRGQDRQEVKKRKKAE